MWWEKKKQAFPVWGGVWGSPAWHRNGLGVRKPTRGSGPRGLTPESSGSIVLTRGLIARIQRLFNFWGWRQSSCWNLLPNWAL